MIRWPISIDDVRRAAAVIGEHLAPTPLGNWVGLDDEIGHGIRVFVKHENHQPTGAFKVRNGLAALAALDADERRRGVVAATRGNHGQGLAWAGAKLGVPVVVTVPLGNNPEKNTAMRALGAELVEHGADYDEALERMRELAAERGLRVVHSTNDAGVLAGAATITLEIVEQEPLDAMVVAVGGGSQSVGALTVARALRPEMQVYGVQAAAAPTIHDSWHAGEARRGTLAPTIADGLATRDVYEMTFGTLQEGLAGFVTVDEGEIASAIRLLLRTTHNLAEGGGAAGLAGLLRLRKELAGQRVGVIVSGANIDRETLRRVVSGEI